MNRGRLNAVVMWALVVILLLLPLFLGGNRPMAWATGTTLLSCVGAFYFLGLLASGEPPRIGMGEFSSPAVPVAVFMVYIVVQVLPIAEFIPASMTSLPGGLPQSRSISISAGDTILALSRWINIALVGYLSIQVAANAFRAERLLSSLFAVVVVHAIYGLLLLFQFGDTILFVEKWAYKGFATGGFVNRNSFATFLALGACIGAARIASAFQRRPAPPGRGFWLLDLRQGPLSAIIGLSIILVALVATGSRMGVAVGMIGMLVVLALHAARRPPRPLTRRGSFWPLAAGAVLVFGIGYLYGMPLVDRFTSVDHASEIRLQLYGQVLGMIADRPLTGFGGGSFEHAYPLYHRAPVDLDHVWDRAHSSYLALWSDYGVIFGSLPIVAVMLLLSTLVAGYAQGQRPDAFVIAAIAGTVVVALHSVVDFSLEMHAVTLFYVALVAGGVGRTLSMRQGDG